MPRGPGSAAKCGQVYSLAELLPRRCITRENRSVIGADIGLRSPKPAPEQVEDRFPFTVRDARFNLPLDRGASGRAASSRSAAGFFLLSEKTPSTRRAPAPAARGRGPVGLLSIYEARVLISRIVHQQLDRESTSRSGPPEDPAPPTPAGWTDLEVLCDQLGIPRA